MAPHLRRYKRFCRFSPLLERHIVDAPQMAKDGRLRHRFYERVASFRRATICGARTETLQTLSVACARYWSASPLTRHRKQNMAAYVTVATSVMISSDALLFVAPQLQRYKRSLSLVPATGAPYFDRPQIVKFGRLRHRFHKRVVSFRRAICGATNTLVERGAKRRIV